MSLEDYRPSGNRRNYVADEGLHVRLNGPIMPEKDVFSKIASGMKSTWGLDRDDDLPDPEKEWAAVILGLNGEAFLGAHLESIPVSFTVIGASRSFCQQLTRCRLAGYGHEGTRDTSLINFDFVMPESIHDHEEFNQRSRDLLEEIRNLIEEMEDAGIPYQDSSMFAPLGTVSDIVAHTNLRVLFDSWRIRLTNQSKWEIRNVFMALQLQILDVWPTIGLWFVAPCELKGSCIANPTLFPPCGKFGHPREGAEERSHFGKPYRFPASLNPNGKRVEHQRVVADMMADKRKALVERARKIMGVES